MLGPQMKTIFGVWALLRLGLESKFRVRGKYWKWRKDTAFGHFLVKDGEKRRAMLEYGKWVAEMQKVARNGRFLR